MWKRVKASWTKEYNRPGDRLDIPNRLAWLVSIVLLGVGWWQIGLWATIKTYWWAIPVALLVIWLCDFWGDWMRKGKQP